MHPFLFIRFQLPIIAELLDFPVEGEFAANLWRLLSGGFMPGDEAAALYRECGYIPFCGYPLSRSGKISRWLDTGRE